MRKCSETKRINADKRIQTELNEILAECVRLGYRPTAADFELRVNSITHLIYMRKRKGQNIPNDWEHALGKIKAYPTVDVYKKIQKAAAEHSISQAFAAREQKVQTIFPKYKLLKLALDADAYKTFINQKFNPITLKILSDYLDKELTQQNGWHMLVNTVYLYLGINVTDQDINAIQQSYQENGITNRPIPSKNGLTTFEISHLFKSTQTCINERIRYFTKRFQGLINRNPVFANCIAGNTDAVMAQLPHTEQMMYKYQAQNNMLGIPTKDLLAAGNLLWDPLRQKQQKNQYEEIKKIFPKIDLLRGHRYFKSLVNAKFDYVALKLLSAYMEYVINTQKQRSAHSERNINMLLKITGLDVSDQDIKLIQTYYQNNNITGKQVPQKTGLSLSELTYRYKISEQTARICLSIARTRLFRQFNPDMMMAYYINGERNRLIQALPDEVKRLAPAYQFQSDKKMTDIPDTDLLNAGRFLFETFKKDKQM